MKAKSNKCKSKLPFLIVLIIPAIFFFLNFHLHIIKGPCSINGYDPEYIYLYSGISLAKLELNVGHIDNPGTPMQILYAVVTRITYTVAGNDDYYSDVLIRSDFYLKIVDLVKISLISFMILLFGCLLYYHSSNIFLALLLQISPFLNIHSLSVFSRIVPETLMIIPVLLLFLYLVKFQQRESNTLDKKEMWIFAFIASFGLSIKLDYLPLIFIPIFLLGSFKRSILYLSGVIFGFFILAFPILFDLKFFFTWVKNLFIHSGRYGSGASNIINWSAFPDNLLSLYNNYPLYVFIVIVLLIVFIYSIFQNNINRKDLNIAVGLLLCNMFHIILMAKQYSPHYILPSVFLFPLDIYIIMSLLIRNRLLQKISISAVIIFFVFNSIYAHNKMLQWKVPLQKEKRSIVEKTRELVGDSPFLIYPQPYNAYFAESGLLFGWFFSGHLRPSANEILKNKFPDHMVYDHRNDGFFYWNSILKASEIAAEYNEFYLFINKSELQKAEKLLDEFRKSMYDKCMYTNDITGDKVFLFTHLTY